MRELFAFPCQLLLVRQLPAAPRAHYAQLKKAGAVKLAAGVLVVAVCLLGCSRPSIENGKRYKFASAEYTGEFKDVKRNGQGTYTSADGSTYTGEFKDGKPNGQGTYTFASGSTYTGNFKDGKPNGQGTMTFASGSTYTGKFKDGKPHGGGRITFPDGTTIIGD